MIPVGRYLPGVMPAGGKITIRELLQHRSGLANYTGYPSWTDPGRAMAVYQAARRAAFRGLPGPCSSHRERSGPIPAPTPRPSRSSRGVWTASRLGLSGSWCFQVAGADAVDLALVAGVAGPPGGLQPPGQIGEVLGDRDGERLRDVLFSAMTLQSGTKRFAVSRGLWTVRSSQRVRDRPWRARRSRSSPEVMWCSSDLAGTAQNASFCACGW